MCIDPKTAGTVGTGDAAERSRFDRCIARIDEENSRDPNRVLVNGEDQPFELAYSRWVTEWVLRLCPEASEALLLASRCQHICRWMVPRASYPMTRPGYLKWRSDLKQFHAERSAAILEETGYGPEVISRVQSLNLKKELGHDSECQVLEDALCLVTLEHQLPELIVKLAEEKLIGVLQKTWRKMSPAGRELAATLPLSEGEKALIERALTGG